jgi:hypothetical protein
MKIIQIQTIPNGKDSKGYHDIIGLGDDNKMYIWNEYTASWDLILVKSS